MSGPKVLKRTLSPISTPGKKPPSVPVISPAGKRETLALALLEDYLQVHQEAVAAIKADVSDPMARVDALSRLSQALDRTLRSLDKASPVTSRLEVAKRVLERQAAFVNDRFPDHLPAFLEVLEPFGQELAEILR